ncbi:MAG: nuclear transport factor 2 family protein, partial [Woeseiaceae bacterium]|nr:nuclear transport factor 2 family protein [Woeseiaceae bacterium]
MTSRNSIAGRINALFAAIDRKDAKGFVEFLTDDAVFRFGSAPAVQGRTAIEQAVSGFFSAIAGCRHELSASWTGPKTFACEGKVTYQRHDGSEITLPFADVFELRGSRICAYRIYIDIAP